MESIKKRPSIERSGHIGHLNLPRKQRIGRRTMQQTGNHVSESMTGKEEEESSRTSLQNT